MIALFHVFVSRGTKAPSGTTLLSYVMTTPLGRYTTTQGGSEGLSLWTKILSFGGSLLTGITLKGRRAPSDTLARRRLREIRIHLASVHAMQHSLYINTGCRTEISCIYDWLSGVSCPDGRIIRLEPPVRHFVNEWISSFDETLPSRRTPFKESWWWTPAVKPAMRFGTGEEDE